MSITDLEKIDILATIPGTSIVRMIITDHLTWDDLGPHMLLLQEKINAYIGGIEAGQLKNLKEHPIPESPDIRIVVICQCEPPAAAYDYFSKFRMFLSGLDLKFEVEVRPQRL